MLPTLTFGSTEHASTRTIFGAAALGKRNQLEADRTMELIIQRGINHIDTAAGYGDSELLLGKWMKAHRSDFFLATKTQDRTYDGARESLHRSLERLQTDHVDLLQLHSLGDEEEWQTAFGKSGDAGALAYLRDARDEGLVRFLGVTGHGLHIPGMHLRSLNEFDFDSVLLPWNFAMSRNPDYARDFKAVRDRCVGDGIAIQTIKSIARGKWAEEQEHTRTTWYEPLEPRDAIERAVFWVLSHPGLFLNTVGDIDLLPAVLDAAERFHSAADGIPESVRPSDHEMQQMLEQTGATQLFV